MSGIEVSSTRGSSKCVDKKDTSIHKPFINMNQT